MLETDPIDCKAEAARCRRFAGDTNDPFIRRSLVKIAESYNNLADWIEAEIAAGRRSSKDL